MKDVTELFRMSDCDLNARLNTAFCFTVFCSILLNWLAALFVAATRRLTLRTIFVVTLP